VEHPQHASRLPVDYQGHADGLDVQHRAIFALAHEVRLDCLSSQNLFCIMRGLERHFVVDKQCVHAAPNHLSGNISEQVFECRVTGQDSLVAIERYDCHGTVIDQRLEVFLLFADDRLISLALSNIADEVNPSLGFIPHINRVVRKIEPSTQRRQVHLAAHRSQQDRGIVWRA